MKKNRVEKVNFAIPIQLNKSIVNADADVIDKNISDFATDSMFIEGLAATNKIDLDKQRLKPEGFILDYFLKTGFLNWNHTAYSPDSIIGEPVDVKVKKDEFYIKGKLYSWSPLAKQVYEVAKNLEEDENTNRTLGFSVEGITWATDKEDFVTKLMVTGCACCFTPKNNDTYLKICKGVTLQEVSDLRKDFLLPTIYSEVEKGVQTDFVVDLFVGNQRLLIDKDMNFHFRDKEIDKNSSLEELQKSIITLSRAVQEGKIKKEKIPELMSALKNKRLKM